MTSDSPLFVLCEKGKFLKASDLHVITDSESRFRIQGDLVPADVIVPQDEFHDFIRENANPAQLERYERTRLIDFAFSNAAFGRVRVHGETAHQGHVLIFRFLPESPLPFEDLGVPSKIAEYADQPSGLILFSGQTGSGKTTLQASLIQRINERHNYRILTYEDPIEYVFHSKKSMISQSELGEHIMSFADGLRGAMRADPNVIILGEMRDVETVEAALAAAETGHLVFATIHASEASHFADRILGFFQPEQHALVRTQLAQTLVGVVGMNLVRKKDGKSRCAAVEVLVGSDAVRALIAKGETRNLRNAMVTARREGMQTLESHLNDLIARNVISRAEALTISRHPDELTPSAA